MHALPSNQAGTSSASPLAAMLLFDATTILAYVCEKAEKMSGRHEAKISASPNQPPIFVVVHSIEICGGLTRPGGIVPHRPSPANQTKIRGTPNYLH